MWRCVLILLTANSAWGCVCSGWSTAKQAWQNASVVIYGTVTFADPEVGTMFHPQTARVPVDEAFKGAFVGQTLEFHLGGSDCDAKFRQGERVLLYPYPAREKGAWTVPPCVGANGADALRFLRELPRSAQGTRLSGEVELYEDSAKQPFRHVGGLPGVKVKISGPDASTYEEVTDADGVYERFGLPPGRYSVSMNAPKGWRIKFPVANPKVRGDENVADLEEKGDASVDFVLQADTRLSGRVIDARGKPVPHVCMQLMEKDGRGERDAFSFECSKEGNGRFNFEMMAPGQYRVVAHQDGKADGIKSRTTLYLPGVREREAGTLITVEAGKYVNGLELRFPTDEKRHNLSGQVKYTDGVPLRGAVTFVSEKSGYAERTEIRPDGSFDLSVVEGIDGELFAEASVILTQLRTCPQFAVAREFGMMAAAETPKLPLTSYSDHGDIKLEMPFASCKASAR